MELFECGLPPHSRELGLKIYRSWSRLFQRSWCDVDDPEFGSTHEVNIYAGFRISKG